MHRAGRDHPSLKTGVRGMWGCAVSWLRIPKAVTVIWEALFTFLDGKTSVWFSVGFSVGFPNSSGLQGGSS